MKREKHQKTEEKELGKEDGKLLRIPEHAATNREQHAATPHAASFARIHSSFNVR